MRTNKEYKNAALAALKGNWAPALLASVIFIGVVWAVILPYYTVELAAYGLINYAASAFLFMAWHAAACEAYWRRVLQCISSIYGKRGE